MIGSLFALNQSGKIIIEKHWRNPVSRQVVDLFIDQVGRASTAYSAQGTPSLSASLEAFSPVTMTQKHNLLHVYRDGMVWLCPVEKEVDPLMVFEFLHRIIDILAEYLGEVNEVTVKDNFVVVYQLLEEVMDNGYPLTTEPNALKEMILPPTIMNRVMNSVASVSGIPPRLPTANLSSIPWRKSGVKYTNNEIYFDIIEEVDAIVDSNGVLVSCEAHGHINVNCRLSGMPDLTLSFVNPRILDDTSFHPCVRINKFESEKILSFVPPDGQFKLMSYRVNLPYQQALPVHVKPSVHVSNYGGKFDITVNSRSTEGRPLENLVLTFPMAKSVTGVNATCSVGQYMFDPTTKSIRWDIGKLSLKDRMPVLSGTFSSSEETPETGHTISLDFQISMYAVSGLKVDTLRVYHEGYKPYKGVRSLTKAGKFQIRT
ncbi:uncharacterized protein VTP21DRAFT_2011 [Calcarisporiella thermophila]|uniref:uncharacterized protein n=1 Tax=Calcarisporiella thermophila TaxID=911321 RepID=UPI00374372FD